MRNILTTRTTFTWMTVTTLEGDIGRGREREGWPREAIGGHRISENTERVTYVGWHSFYSITFAHRGPDIGSLVGSDVSGRPERASDRETTTRRPRPTNECPEDRRCGRNKYVLLICAFLFLKCWPDAQAFSVKSVAAAIALCGPARCRPARTQIARRNAKWPTGIWQK